MQRSKYLAVAGSEQGLDIYDMDKVLNSGNGRQNLYQASSESSIVQNITHVGQGDMTNVLNTTLPVSY